MEKCASSRWSKQSRPWHSRELNDRPHGTPRRQFHSRMAGVFLSLLAFLVASLPLSARAQSRPAITTQPQSQTVNAGTNVSFTVVASGQTPFTYLWSLNTSALTNGARI